MFGREGFPPKGRSKKKGISISVNRCVLPKFVVRGEHLIERHKKILMFRAWRKHNDAFWSIPCLNPPLCAAVVLNAEMASWKKRNYCLKYFLSPISPINNYAVITFTECSNGFFIIRDKASN